MLKYSQDITDGGSIRMTLVTKKSLAICGIVLLLFSCSFIIMWIKKPITPIFHIEKVLFKLGEKERTIEVYVKVERGIIEPKRFLINDKNVSKWTIDSHVIKEGEEAKIILEYRWEMNKFYIIKLLTSDGRIASTGKILSPRIEPTLSLRIKNLTTILNSSLIRINVSYEAKGKGIDATDILLFSYLSFEKKSRKIVIFYDPDYMFDSALKRASTIISYLERYGVSLCKARFNDLEKFKRTPETILILVNPLKDKLGRKVENAMPAPLIDPDHDGYIRDNSNYNKSLLYDLMKDNGLIFITIGSLQPHKRILYANGTYTYTRDSFETFDAHKFFTDASGNESIIKGNFVIGNYTGVRISGTLGILKREASFGFDKEILEKYGLKYYAYGDYTLDYNGKKMNFTLPVFIRVGEGGWLVMGDEEYWLTDEQIAHELFLILLQSIWDSEWMPYGWYWDSGSDHYINSGILNVTENVETEYFSPNIINKQIIIRLIAVTYSYDLKKGMIIEESIVYEIS